MKIQRVPVSHGWLWIMHAYRLLMRSPLQALSMAMAFAMLMFLIMLVPVVGPLLAILTMPVLMAGYVRTCKALEYSAKVEPRFALAGFENKTARLANLGVMLLLGIMIVSMVISTLGGAAMSEILKAYQVHQNSNTLLEAMLATGTGVRTALFTGFGLMLVLMLAMQFAPMLVFFDEKTPLEALKSSLFASVFNIVPMLVYFLIMQVFAFVLSAIPFGLGLIVLLPIALTSMYVAYRDIFAEPVKTEVESTET